MHMRIYLILGVLVGLAATWLHHAELRSALAKVPGSPVEASWLASLSTGLCFFGAFVLVGLLHGILRELESIRKIQTSRLGVGSPVEDSELAFSAPGGGYPQDRPNHEKNIVPDFD